MKEKQSYDTFMIFFDLKLFTDAAVSMKSYYLLKLINITFLSLFNLTEN